MNSKNREATHHYNLRSFNKPKLRPRVHNLRNRASIFNSHSLSSYQNSRNTTHQQQHKRGRLQNKAGRTISQYSRDGHQQGPRTTNTACKEFAGLNRNSTHNVLSDIPTSSSDTPADASDDIECAICLDTVNDSTFTTVRCGHRFHKICCDEWMNVNNICPICRYPGTPKSSELLIIFSRNLY